MAEVCLSLSSWVGFIRFEGGVVTPASGHRRVQQGMIHTVTVGQSYKDLPGLWPRRLLEIPGDCRMLGHRVSSGGASTCDLSSFWHLPAWNPHTRHATLDKIVLATRHSKAVRLSSPWYRISPGKQGLGSCYTSFTRSMQQVNMSPTQLLNLSHAYFCHGA